MTVMGEKDTQLNAGTRRVARNTLLLYVRMFLLMLIGLYTSRVVLQALGETDFGVIPFPKWNDRCFGALEYRSLRFEHERHDETDNLQGNAVVNYTDASVPYTRTIEHKHFEFQCAPGYTGERTPFTIVSKEYSSEWKPGVEPYYPVNDAKNQARYEEYAGLAAKEKGVFFGGRLGSYRYYDMQDSIAAALRFAEERL